MRIHALSLQGGSTREPLCSETSRSAFAAQKNRYFSKIIHM